MTNETKDPRALVEHYTEFARRDDCLDQMVPSDLRVIIGALTAALDRAEKAETERDDWRIKAENHGILARITESGWNKANATRDAALDRAEKAEAIGALRVRARALE